MEMYPQVMPFVIGVVVGAVVVFLYFNTKLRGL